MLSLRGELALMRIGLSSAFWLDALWTHRRHAGNPCLLLLWRLCLPLSHRD